MTRLAILSDIHGNLSALEAVLHDLAGFAVEQVIIPGDTIHFGPASNSVAQKILENNWPAIRGNNEYFLLDFDTPQAPVEWNDPIQFAPTRWTNQQITPQVKQGIERWPDSLELQFKDAPPLHVFHGTPNSTWEPIYATMPEADIAKLCTTVSADYLICGHTHLPMDIQVGRWRIFNPGSVGLPLDGFRTASYLLLDGTPKGWQPTFRRVEFDHAAVLQAFETSGYNAHCGPMGRLIVEIHKTARPTFGFLAWRKEQHPLRAISDELLDEYLTTCEWWEYALPPYRINMG